MFEKVCAILAEITNVDISQMTMDTNLRNDLEMNSIDTVSAIVRFEEEFDIEISDKKISDFHTIGDIVAFLD